MASQPAQAATPVARQATGAAADDAGPTARFLPSQAVIARATTADPIRDEPGGAAHLTAPRAPSTRSGDGRAARLAALTGGLLADAPDGRQSVVFARGAAAGAELARVSAIPAPMAPVPAAPASPPMTPAPPAPVPASQPNGAPPSPLRHTPPMPAPFGTPAATQPDVDELYDVLLTRLRRELLLDRERGGELP